MMNIAVVSNTCVGVGIHNNTRRGEYTTPFISTFIVNDDEYIRLCCNLKKYANITPVLGLPKKDSTYCKQSGSEWYMHPGIKRPYPVLHLDDVEIHMIHEDNETDALDKYNRRNSRFLNILNNDTTKIVCTLSFTELINNHTDLPKLIDTFLSNNNDKIISLFAGPRYLYKESYGNKYIIVDQWNNCSLKRDPYHVYEINGQPFNISLFTEHIRKYC